MDQVVCVRDDWGHKPNLQQWPVVGGVYTIREQIKIKAVHSKPPMLFYRFEEILNKPIKSCNEMTEPVFDADWFKPVRKTSIEVFTKTIVPELV